MGQQHRKVTKRRRRSAYLKRQKEMRKNSRTAAPLAKKVLPSSSVAEKAGSVAAQASEVASKEPVKKVSTKKTTATKSTTTEKPKKAPAKKTAATKGIYGGAPVFGCASLYQHENCNMDKRNNSGNNRSAAGRMYMAGTFGT